MMQNRCYFKNVTEPFPSMEHWVKRLYDKFWKDAILAELQAQMSRGCRFLLFLHHTYQVSLKSVLNTSSICAKNYIIRDYLKWLLILYQSDWSGDPPVLVGWDKGKTFAERIKASIQTNPQNTWKSDITFLNFGYLDWFIWGINQYQSSLH